MTDFNPFEFKPQLSEGSKKLYLSNLVRLNEGKPITNLNFLSKVEKINEQLSQQKPNTRKTYLIAIASALANRPEAKWKKLYNTYYPALDALNKEQKVHTDKTPTQQENWMEQEDIKSIYDKLKAIIPTIEKKRKITEDQYTQMLQALILSLYTAQAPRRNKDYTDMVIVKVAPKDLTEKNYLELSTWNWVFNNYKTQKTYHQKTIPVPEEIKSILQVYFKFHPKSKEIKSKKKSDNINVPFLMTQDGKALDNSTDMTRALNTILGKKVGSSMLRNIFLTDKYGGKMAELKQDTEAMATSVDTALNNYIKEA